MEERLQLALERIREIKQEKKLKGPFQDCFERMADFLILMEEERRRLAAGKLKEAKLEELKRQNRSLYQDILPENYENSFANPQKAVELLGENYGQLLAALYAEMYSLPVYLYEERTKAAVIRMELFLEIYGAFLEAALEDRLPAGDSLKEIYFWFAHDYIEEILKQEVKSQFDRSENWIGKLLDETDLNDLRYLFAYGEYVTENELKLAAFMNSLPEETIQKMADTYTEGYRRGFAATGKDISIKKAVNVIYVLGMERMVKAAMKNFRKMGLEPVLYRTPASFLAGRRLYKSGVSGAVPNKQFEYDHEYDKALYFNSRFLNRKLEAYRQALEEVKEEAKLMGGPAVIEDFGDEPFVPQSKKENLKLEEHRQKQEVEYQAKASELSNQYIKREERSFTIIAFPSPAIGENFEEIFAQTIRLNTLDNQLYEKCQQSIIDVLDRADHVVIKGCGENETDLQVALCELKDPAKQTNFENCVADVNIPVGEVFTSPKLKGTNGLLHVPKVFLHGMEYRNLRITFKEGMISDYSCDNFDDPKEGRKLMKEKLLYHHDSLPLGEFAIGTNTTAYMAAKKYDIGALLPILIAEKTGPHFAIGDTCYSWEEETVTYNPNGKQIMAKENECSMKRHEDRKAAYFNCHTDITIPYEELGLLAAVTKSGESHPVIERGRFVLPSCEELNKAFDE
ncbi:MAG: aminopeptidase [Lachnospiraceae bacterium]|nr:aminopeptidase [Lachnospiraceae bacterium]